MISRFVIAASLCAGGMIWAEPPSLDHGPVPVTKGLILPRFRLEEASRYLADDALSQRDVPGAVVVVVAVDDRKRAVEISTSVKQQFEPQHFYLKHYVGNMRLYAFMNKPGAMDASGLGMHNYGCFYPCAAVPP